MKYLLLLLISVNVHANSLPLSEILKAINLEPNAGSISCAQLPEEQCISYEGIEWEAAILIDEVDDIGIYTGKKLLRHSPVRKAAKEAKEQAEKDAEDAEKNKKQLIREKLKGIKKSDLSSNAKTVDLLMEVIELLK